MKRIEIVETLEEAISKASEKGIDISHLDPDNAITSVNNFLVMDELTLPDISIDISNLKVLDILLLKDQITLEIEEYRIIKFLEDDSKSYLALVKVKEENDDEYNIYFYAFDEKQLDLIVITEVEWPLVEDLYKISLEEPPIELQLF